MHIKIVYEKFRGENIKIFIKLYNFLLEYNFKIIIKFLDFLIRVPCVCSRDILKIYNLY